MRQPMVCFALLLLSSWSIAQTVLSNESLVTTTLVVNKTPVTVQCGKSGCKTEKKSMLAAIPVNCPAPTGQTCTLHIALDTKVSVGSLFGGVSHPGPTSFFQFLIDDAPPTFGPTDAHGNYMFAQNVVTDRGTLLVERQSYAASVVTSVQSGNHKIDVNLACIDLFDSGGCLVTAHWSTMRIDVFEP